MSQPLVRYNTESHAPLKSPLLLAPPDAVPPVDELEAVQTELKSLKQESLERARKADGDLKVIEVAIKKMRELEKGKAKALARVKREPSYTPSLDHDDRGFSPSAPPPPASAASSSTIPSINVSSPSLPSKVPPEMRKIKKKDKDKKRKREDESEGEHDSPRPRKFSPHPPSHKEHHYKPSKLSNVSHPKTASGPDWTLPQMHPLIPPRPAAVPLPAPGPRKPSEVKEDFSKAKAPASQVPINTFYASVEPWIRQIREEDLGFLQYTADEVEPFVMPKLGRHYSEAWEEEDQLHYGGIPSALDFSSSRNGTASGSSAMVPLPKWDSSTITEADLVSDKGLGPVTERLVSALLPAADQSTWKSMKEAEDAYETKMAASGSGMNGLSPSKDKVFVADFEERVKDRAHSYGLLRGEPDFSQVVDDPISSALRQAQRQLREVIATNKARKARLLEIAQDRLAYQEYVEARDTIDKNISATFTKLQKKDGPKVSKKKKKNDMATGLNGVNGSGAPPVPLPNPASIGLGPDEGGGLIVPDALRSLVETRRQWVDVFGGAFDEMEAESPGRIRGLPQRSVFEGVEEEVRQELARYGLHPSKRVGTGERTDGASGTGGDRAA